MVVVVMVLGNGDQKLISGKLLVAKNGQLGNQGSLGMSRHIYIA